MATDKKYIAFLSYADTDKDLARAISELFQSLKEEVFFASESLERSAGGVEWRKSLINAIKRSHCFIPIYTRHSIRRPWIMFESGVSEAYGLKRFPTRVSGVSLKDIESIGKDVQVYRLHELESLTQLCINVCLAKPGSCSEDFIRNKLPEIIKKNRYAKSILELSKIRWVFIAGNQPQDIDSQISFLPHFRSKQQYLDELQKYVEALTLELIRKGFGLVSCPQVDTVGRVVSTKYLQYTTENPKEKAHYRIGGFYLRESPKLEGKIQELWWQQISEFRKSYLEDVDRLVVIGGGSGTKQEYEAALELGIKIDLVPFFGGISYRLWFNGNSDRKRPYERWSEKEGVLPARDLVEYFKQ
jgi:hypothetical protein